MSRIEQRLRSIAIANLKANSVGAASWLTAFKETILENTSGEKPIIIVAPPFIDIQSWERAIKKSNLPIVLGAQDVSSMPSGKHTGETPAEMLKKTGVEFVIIGHSERRALGDTDEKLVEKVEQAYLHELKVIYCVPKVEEVPLSDAIAMIAYEPLAAIGSGTPESPATANSVCRTLYEQTGKLVLYGGSVVPENVADYLEQPFICGVLVGGASLDGQVFAELTNNAQSKSLG